MEIEKLKNSLSEILSCTDLKKESPTSYAGPCPRCGGKDRFVYKTDTEKCWCRQCHEKSMDIIDFHCWLYGKTLDDLFAEYLPGNQKKVNNKFHHFKLGDPVKIYPYYDQDGKILYNVCRFEPKKFRPCDPGGKYKVKGIKPVPYNLPAITKADSVFICEGEKDADTINKMGLTGTCKANWTGKWSKEFAEYFKGKAVYILQDSDKPGDNKAQDAVQVLSQDKGIKVKLVPAFSKQKGFDVSDWIQDGHTKKELLKIVDSIKWLSGNKSENNIINGLDLFKKEFKPIKWAVHNILAEGCSILAGKPKCGKSIFCLNIAIAITAGTKALSHIDVEPGHVLYLALEDVHRRLKTRLQQMLQGDDPTTLKNLHMATDWPKMGEGGIQKLDDTIQSIADIRLVIIDTLKMIRPETKNTKSIYDSDYEPISAIKKIADKNNVSILVIHHLRKSDADDIMDTFSGSLGLTGATDTNLILERQTGNADATLHVNGRDVEATEYAMRFQPGTMSWRIMGIASEVKSTEKRQKIYDALKQAEKALSPKELADITGYKNTYIRNSLPSLIKEGFIQKKDRGKYIFIGDIHDNSDEHDNSDNGDNGKIYSNSLSLVTSHQNKGDNCKPLKGKRFEEFVTNVTNVPTTPEDSDAEYF